MNSKKKIDEKLLEEYVFFLKNTKEELDSESTIIKSKLNNTDWTDGNKNRVEEKLTEISNSIKKLSKYFDDILSALKKDINTAREVDRIMNKINYI